MKRFYTVITVCLLSLPNFLFSQTYCTPTFTSCGSNNYISSVSVGGMSNTATGCTVSNYLNKVASINAGDTISMNVTCAGWDGVAIFVDLNNDGDFVDTLELLYNHYKAPTPPISYTFDITVPINTVGGNHRMRVMCGNGGSVSGNPNPCQGVAWGNFHDYTLYVNNNCQADSLLTVSNITPTSANFSWAPRNGSYEYVLDTLPGNPSGAGIATSLTTHSASGLTNGKHYYFHIRTSCGNGAYSPWGSVDFVACQLPNAQINQSGDIKLCKGDTLTLSVPNNASNTYQWYRNGNKIPGKTQNTLEVFLFIARYHVKVESFPGCSSTSDAAKVTIHDKPNAPILTAVGPVLTSSGFPLYKWYKNGTFLNGFIDSTYTATTSGFYHVEGVDTNWCSALSDTIEITGVGVNEILRSEVKIYPNPSNGMIFIEHQSSSALLVEVQNILGEKVLSTGARNQPKVSIDLKDQKPGIYFIVIQNDSARIVEKVLIE